jgi:radical SAM superfamily enzyme YgiQ (UPF0313 family)
MVSPCVSFSYWSVHHVGGSMKSLVPPLGLLTIAALCPKDWTIRLLDLNFEELRDEDVRQADLIMLSGMQDQRRDLKDLLVRIRALGGRTMIGGPYASSEPESLLPLADHVVVGEPDAEFARIAADLENGSARRLYTISEKPDLTCPPVPRFDLLRLDRYVMMAVQFSRGCPFQCEFCDIITIYGRKPRAKPPSAILVELDLLFKLGFRGHVFVVDDNFIGNHKLALELAENLEAWSQAHRYPFTFFTEASIDLAQRPALLQAMVRANFYAVFVGIESPVQESLLETKKFQNLRRDLLESIRFIQESGLWVLGGFIVGFDSDPEDIFERQREFVERADIPWAMMGFLQAAPTTPLYRHLLEEGRLLEPATNNFAPPNFETKLPLPLLLRGMRNILQQIYDPSLFYDRCLRSFASWKVQDCQKAPSILVLPILGAVLHSVWSQGIVAPYRRAWWTFLFALVRRWHRVPLKLWWGMQVLISGQHFIEYTRQVVEQLERELPRIETLSTLEKAAGPVTQDFQTGRTGT